VLIGADDVTRIPQAFMIHSGSRKRSMVSALLALAILVVASGCVTGIDHLGGWYKRAYVGDDALLDVAEFIIQPLAFCIELLVLRFVWDHSEHTFSGLLSMLCRLAAILPGWVHEDGSIYPGGPA
jgi:hypothetical protein